MSENKKILINTVFLYFRMIVIIGITLYTVRVLYNTLGIEDYGLFNLIAGFILLFSFLNSAMRSGTQRFLNIAIASNNIMQVRSTFSVALNIHVIIALLVLVFSETIGLWFLNNHLNLPENKIYISNIVYQCAVVTTIISIFGVPYQALIIAKERMNLFAYASIFEAIAKLLIIFIVMYLAYRQSALITYSVLLIVVSILVFILYFIYVLINFRQETKYVAKANKILTKEIVSFSGWNLFGQISVLSSNQGVTLIYNIFLGVTINASLAISQQVTALLNNFVSNLQLAFNPQIVKSFASKDFKRHEDLVLNSSRYSLYLITIIAIPFLFYSDYILRLWLGSDLPKYVEYFSTVVVLVAVLDALSGPFWMSAHAKGDIKKYQIIISAIFLLNLPLTFFIFKATESVYFSFLTYLLFSLLALIYRVYYFFEKCEAGVADFINYFKKIILVFIFIFVICFFKFIYLNELKKFEFNEILFSLVILEISFIFYLILFCISKNEFNLIKSYILIKLKFKK